MKSTLVNEFIYIKNSVSKIPLNYSIETIIKTDYLYNASELSKIEYCHNEDLTFIYLKNHNMKHYFRGNKILNITEILNRNYTKGIIIENIENTDNYEVKILEMF